MTVAICDDCWCKQEGERVPTRFREPDEERCYACGETTRSGIYVRRMTSSEVIGKTKELAEHIAGYPRVRLCQQLDGSLDNQDWLLSERDRYLIVQALRAYDEHKKC